eukprot:g65972.t1
MAPSTRSQARAVQRQLLGLQSQPKLVEQAIALYRSQALAENALQQLKQEQSEHELQALIFISELVRKMKHRSQEIQLDCLEQRIGILQKVYELQKGHPVPAIEGQLSSLDQAAAKQEAAEVSARFRSLGETIKSFTSHLASREDTSRSAVEHVRRVLRQCSLLLVNARASSIELALAQEDIDLRAVQNILNPPLRLEKWDLPQESGSRQFMIVREDQLPGWTLQRCLGPFLLNHKYSGVEEVIVGQSFMPARTLQNAACVACRECQTRLKILTATGSDEQSIETSDVKLELLNVSRHSPWALRQAAEEYTKQKSRSDFTLLWNQTDEEEMIEVWASCLRQAAKAVPSSPTRLWINATGATWSRGACTLSPALSVHGGLFVILDTLHSVWEDCCILLVVEEVREGTFAANYLSQRDWLKAIPAATKFLFQLKEHARDGVVRNSLSVGHTDSITGAGRLPLLQFLNTDAGRCSDGRAVQYQVATLIVVVSSQFDIVVTEVSKFYDRQSRAGHDCRVTLIILLITITRTELNTFLSLIS